MKTLGSMDPSRRKKNSMEREGGEKKGSLGGREKEKMGGKEELISVY